MKQDNRSGMNLTIPVSVKKIMISEEKGPSDQ